ncbi:fused MFS/spermidine synthase [Geomonas nitrogeniifigens]|uniref:Fused MFS/spermidine synthase n=1 Tax=Geomonas diazotrophica TaxID=2843197 RepID=A0ABX8JGB2_9BACT|nr:fused MFS/spermidine synthase [Geomonas nitrogeniifigens]QWV96512.1 fused MFS/spermidine synthase [Geomonas nitrogeniifigens]
MMRNKSTAYFLIFALSGFSGLIYESIWTHYLKLFLGHAAYAQSLVLAIFMGGMAIGSWICSRYSTRWHNLMLWYATTEAVIGVCALFFHLIFTAVISLAYTSIIPFLGSPTAISLFKWVLSALLILPQSILLGMTFPLMSAAILRMFPEKPGRSLGMLYFSNSIGAAAGVLATGFYLIKAFGLPWTVAAGGIINIILAATVWFMLRGSAGAAPDRPASTATPAEAASRLSALFLLVSLVTGTASFIYEIGWIRMLSLVMGTSTHAFELMLCAFILGLALGGCWLQRRIDTLAAPCRFLGWVQVIMGGLALLTLCLYGNSFEVMAWGVKALPKTDAGYLLFNLFSSGIALCVMLPATFCAGMTLPLITFILLGSGGGERSIGAVYAANTIGAIIGVFFAIHIGLPMLGLKGLITFGAGLDIAMGVMLFWKFAASGEKGVAMAVTMASAGALVAVPFLLHLDPYKMSSGVYRYGTMLNRNNTQLVFYEDGKTASISLVKDQDGSLAINTNGKTDASMFMGGGNFSTGDEATAVLLGALPMAFNTEARTVAAIGLGSGLTSETLLCNPDLRSVDTIEIEEKMIRGASLFKPLVGRVYSDPRSRIIVDDAKTYFSIWGKKYDIIVSEPSNPWVSGVSGLFSTEFYALAKRHLEKNGIFVQWVQMYEIDTNLVMSVLKAVSGNFNDYVVYAANDSDLVILASDRKLDSPSPGIFAAPRLKKALTRIHVLDPQDLSVRKVGNKRFFEKVLATYEIPANSDYRPVIDQNAAKTRFLRRSAHELVTAGTAQLPTFEMLGGGSLPRTQTSVIPSEHSRNSQAAYGAMILRDFFSSGQLKDPYDIVSPEVKQAAQEIYQLFKVGEKMPDHARTVGALLTVGASVAPYLTARELDDIWGRLEASPHAADLPVAVRQTLAVLKAVGRRDPAAMSQTARLLLADSGNLAPGALQFLVQCAMLGEVAQGNAAGAAAVWAKYGAQPLQIKDGDLLTRLLLAETKKTK